MVLNVGMFLMFTGAYVFLQVGHVNADRARCVFPFNYKNKLYDSCTSDGSFIRKAWCSVTANYDKDGAWKNCFD
ncbi:Seminal plasma protein HSP-1 [Myotis davidii]|uniref:Seminal plasma protein HSP-1 n=1 Tax=Myotis davidii TaxID=225400 RepID=L5LXB2_MYODS|nr:Seminal plasma protein HSP-1 [Myotis davidii]